MAHLSIAIDPITNDIYLDANNSLAMVTDAQAVGQHARQRLLTFHGEHFLDSEVGVEWLDEVLGLRQNPELARTLVQNEILETDGVTDISTFSVDFDDTTRGLSIKGIEVETIYDEEAQL